MFVINLVDIGGDGLVTDFTSDMVTLAEVELLITNSINEHLGVACTVIRHIDDLTYDVLVNGHEIGLVVIKDVNPAKNPAP